MDTMEKLEMIDSDHNRGAGDHMDTYENREIWRLYVLGRHPNEIATTMSRSRVAVYRCLRRNPQYQTLADPIFAQEIDFGHKDRAYYDSEVDQLNAMAKGPKLYKFPSVDIEAIFKTDTSTIHDIN